MGVFIHQNQCDFFNFALRESAFRCAEPKSIEFLFDSISAFGIGILLLFSLALPFLLWNSHVIQRQLPWPWRPFWWPGWTVLTMGIIGWLSLALFDFAAESIIPRQGYLLFSIFSVSIEAFFLWWLVGKWLRCVHPAWAWMHLRNLFVQILLFGVLALLLVLPLLLGVLLAVFVLPQYQSLLSEGRIESLLIALQIFASIRNAGAEFLLMTLALAIMTYSMLAVARLRFAIENSRPVNYHD